MKKWSLIVSMCMACLSLNAQHGFIVKLLPIVACSDNLEHFYNRHKLPKKQMLIVSEGNMLYVQNAPVGGGKSHFMTHKEIFLFKMFSLRVSMP